MTPKSATEPAIRIEDLAVTFPGPSGPLTALDGLSGQVAGGELLAVIGPNGSGKSTLLRAIAGVLPPTRGRIGLAPGELQPKAGDGRVGLVFQQPRLLAWRDTLDNVTLLLELAGMDPAERRAAGERALARVGLSEAAALRPRELSGGMQQRAALARSLVTDPPILLLDEPFSALDALTREAFNAQLESLWLAHPRTIVFVTHSVSEAVRMADRVWVMTPRPGRIAADIEIPLPRPRGAGTAPDPAAAALEGQVRDALASVHAPELTGWAEPDGEVAA
jgi:NitT/TauT family transport system ATP-binding protein